MLKNKEEVIGAGKGVGKGAIKGAAKGAGKGSCNVTEILKYK